ncbi:MAG: hypothetical protein Q9163_004142 [Psora crenata]
MSLKPITINGNTIEPTLHGPGLELSSLDARDASGTQYILIQTEGPLSSEQKEDLKSAGAVCEIYISEDTYLCRYEPSDLEALRSKPFVNYANVYLTQLKVHRRLKSPAAASMGSEGATEPKAQVDIVFHDGVDASSPNIKAAVVEKAHLDEGDLAISARKIRLTVDKQHLDDIAAIDEVRSIEEVRPPQLYNNVARGILRADVNVQGTSYTGEGQTVAVADTGFDKGQASGDVHPAFRRVRRLYSRGKADASDPDGGHGHGTHVCGSVLGNAHSDTLGITIQGTAPEATLVMQACADGAGNLTGIPFDLETLFNQPYSADNARIHTNSWGTPLPGNGEQGEYDASAAEIDQFVWDHKDMVICFAAGNDGMDADRNGVVDARQIGSQAAAKNSITVGAGENDRPDISTVYGDFQGFVVNPLNRDRIANNSEGMAAFSSRGPTAENRLKPDVVAPGTAILSARARGLSGARPASQDPLYAFMSGTSMACPLVAGCTAVLRETLVKNGEQNPTAALIKALLINGAVNMRGQYQTADVGPSPNPINGWGRVNLANSVVIPGAQSNGGFNQAGPLRQGQDDVFAIDIPGGATLKITLVWTDFPGPLLQNDLDLIVVAANGEERHGNMGTGPGFDRINNVEQVIWPGMPAGDARVIIRCARITRGAQDYAYAWRIS